MSVLRQPVIFARRPRHESRPNTLDIVSRVDQNSHGRSGALPQGDHCRHVEPRPLELVNNSPAAVDRADGPGKAASNTWHSLRTYPFFLACFFKPQLWMALGPMVVSVFALKGALA